MKQNEWINLIHAPQSANFSDVEKLEKLKKEFPFFQSAHLLLSLTSKKHNSSLYQQTLKNTAISIPNRSRLFYLLNYFENVSDNPKQNNNEEKNHEIITTSQKESTSEIQHLQTIEIRSEKQKNKFTEEELNEQVNKEIEKQVVSVLVEKELLNVPSLKKSLEVKKEVLKSGSFSDWLKEYKSEDGSSHKKKEISETEIKKSIKFEDNKKASQKNIIDKIIESDPGNIRLNPAKKFYAPNNNAKESLLENEDLVTETLAKIYGLQGQTAKAIRAYEILSLKFPQKSAYFASLIENLKI